MPKDSHNTYQIKISGQVQGVGFRPFVYNLALKYQIRGTVSNNEDGVAVYCNSSKKKVADFLSDILNHKPETAIITTYSIIDLPYIEYNSFEILPSEINKKINIPLTPDFAICNNCKTELSEAANRRYHYAFTTCVHCGPRYAITNKFPFERAHTTMDDFIMCDTCKMEYKAPTNKRFHSQTNSCSSCGIQLQLTTNSAEVITKNQIDCIDDVASFIIKGNIIAIKNTSGYLLCCDATNRDAVITLRKRKKRPHKPFAVIYSSLEAVKKDFNPSIHEERMLQSGVAPIVILQNTKKTAIAVNAIAPNINQTGVMLPSSALLELIMQKVGRPIIATSGNLHGSPILSEEKEARKKLEKVADYFLNHNLNIQFPQDDSVVKFADSHKLVLRRARGLAPNYIEAKAISKEPVLAMGAHLKSTFTFVPNTQLYVSQYFGNLENFDVLERYKTAIDQYIELFQTSPKTILIDRHAQYESSILGEELASKIGAKIYPIQHHKAHFASVLGENQLFTSNKKILGVIWDGVGLGDDNQVWGGEFFTYHNSKIERLTHFEYYDWIANDKMSTEPRLALFSLLNDKNLVKNKFSETEWSIYTKTITKNTLITSSVGRLFDAVASALDIVDVNTFEAEAAIQLENCASSYAGNHFTDFLDGFDYDKIPSQYIIETITKTYRKGGAKEQLAYSFIYTLAMAIIKIAQKNHIDTIACSGGVFQNSLLTEILIKEAEKQTLILNLNRELSPNDENISFGQFMYHQHIKN
ncbi:carbamoyltransferase HypF [Echinicola strongylocentroti]|uniref:Carbamoyltransferase n=1 Tax=Echinicola strongylocentroti TaxID=1795355 RepID=A0A2Z4IDR1_9BACT|nr:carbamoyltransferase HypF [Echinicola strongylocentroti]AWW28935.1 carbamoyltransferase HypF [Echinicola strongylocentroti]